jgi:hypothetical protein
MKKPKNVKLESGGGKTRIAETHDFVTDADDLLYYWIAINGPSAAMTPIPFPDSVVCSPRPEVLVGIRDHAEAKRVQRLLLTAPIDEARREVERLEHSRDVVFRRVDSPQGPGASTEWSVGG